MKIIGKLEGFNNFSKKIFENINSPSETLLNAMNYSFFSGGKRIRAQFVYAIGEILKLSEHNCHTIAFAIEAIHTYSLIHDDLPAMDNDDIRRGKPTCHIKFDEATAILAGDALQSLAFEILQEIEVTDIDKLKKINKFFSECCGVNGIVGGQQLDIEGEGKFLELNALQTVHTYKTAKMFMACVILPYYTTLNNNIKIEKLLLQLSELIGLCFQIKDDILDVTKSTEQLGKTSSKDISSNKSTYVSLMGLENASLYLENKKVEINQILSELKSYNFHSETFDRLISLVINRNY